MTLVERPDDPKNDLGGVWGFPAVTLIDDETMIDGTNRIADSKLGIKINLGKRIGESTHDRATHVLTLADYEATMLEGMPIAPKADTSVTKYSECKFTNDSTILYAAARKGSRCTQILLDSIGADW